MSQALKFSRNDPRQYDDLADAWWDSNGAFAMLHWLASARAELVPPASRTNAVLLDVGCGGGLMAPHLAHKGYRHVGVDITASALDHAEEHGIEVSRADVHELPIASESIDVVCAGEIFEHVADVGRVVAETSRVLRPGGLIVIDTLANTRLARLLAVTIAERVPGGAPRGIHDPELFVDRSHLIGQYARYGVSLQLRGLRPHLRQAVAWRLNKRREVQMLPTRFSSVLFQAWGRKEVV